MLYIPITHATLEQLSQSPNDLAVVIQRLSPPELAALVLIYGIPSLYQAGQSNEAFISRAERLLARFIEHPSSQALQQELIHTLKPEQILAGKALLEKVPIQLMTTEQIQARNYLKWDNQWVWDWEFKNREQPVFFPSRLLNKTSPKTLVVSKDQERLVSIILADKSESVSVQGYAGSGKTKIISFLADELSKDKPLFLTETWEQAQALRQKLTGAQVDTFAGTVNFLIRNKLLGTVRNISDRYGKQYNNSGQRIFSDEQLADKLECFDIGDYRRGRIIKDARQVVENFCYSTDPIMTTKHIPERYVRFLTPLKQQALLVVAKRMWELVCIPQGGILLPLRNYHLIKALALSGMGIVRECSHIIVDESHNLSPATLQILQQTAKPVLTFGDYYQALQGLDKPHHLPSILNSNTLTRSVRIGENMAGFYNKLMLRHPIAPEAEFLGNNTKRTQIEVYKQFTFPEKPCFILAYSYWSVFWLAYTLYLRNGSCHILQSYKNEFDWLIKEAIDFFYGTKKPSHYEFYGADSWLGFIDRKRQTEPTIDDIDQWIQSGRLNKLSLAEFLRSATEPPQANTYQIRRVWDCRNIEFERVCLFNDVINNAGTINRNYAQTISHIYTGTSRAQNELYIPALIKDWLDNT